VLHGGLDSDMIDGGYDSDTIYGDAGIDYLMGNRGHDRLFGGEGDDVLIGGLGSDILNGGAGVDKVDYAYSASGVTVSLVSGATGSGGDAAGDTFSGIENILGSTHNDTLTGNTLANVLDGSIGNDELHGNLGSDTLRGNIGNDKLFGEAGHDVLDGNAGADLLDGGAGGDTATYQGSNAAVTINLATGAASGGFAQGDTLVDVEHVTGSSYNDSIIGNAAANVLRGGAGNDAINASAGSDRIVGGFGKDTMAGGGGGDVFAFENVADSSHMQAKRDIVTDFQHGSDRIDLRAFDFNQGATFIGTQAMHGNGHGEVSYEFEGNNTMVYADTNGDGTDDFAVQLNGQVNLTASDFMLV
jgi:Ca2+-binding RTX toxin-like protein